MPNSLRTLIQNHNLEGIDAALSSGWKITREDVENVIEWDATQILKKFLAQTAIFSFQEDDWYWIVAKACQRGQKGHPDLLFALVTHSGKNKTLHKVLSSRKFGKGRQAMHVWTLILRFMDRNLILMIELAKMGIYSNDRTLEMTLQYNDVQGFKELLELDYPKPVKKGVIPKKYIPKRLRKQSQRHDLAMKILELRRKGNMTTEYAKDFIEVLRDLRLVDWCSICAKVTRSYYFDGSLPIAEMLLDLGSDTEIRDPYGRTPLMIAISRHDDNMMRLLFKNGASVNARCFDEGCTPLMWAVKSSRPDSVLLVRYLMSERPPSHRIARVLESIDHFVFLKPIARLVSTMVGHEAPNLELKDRYGHKLADYHRFVNCWVNEEMRSFLINSCR